MVMSTFQKVTLATCLVLCVALLLPKMLLSRGRKDAAERPEGSGNFPPMMHRQEARGQRVAGSGFSRAHNPEAAARAKGAGPGAGTAGKSNLAGQIIPVYGFGILLYILYILFKITSKGNSKPSEGRFPSVRAENMKRKITDFELAQLQEKLRETELVMENIVSNAHHSPDRVKGVMADQEESLLQQLTEITRVMQEGQLVEGMTAEKKKSQESWEDYPEESPQFWDHQHCCCPHAPPGAGEPQEAPAGGAEADQGLDSGPEHAGGEEEEREGGAAATAAAEQDDPGVKEEGGGSDLGVKEEGGGSDLGVKEEGGGSDLGVPEAELAGVLQELEITLKMTTMLEREKIDDLSRPAEAESGYGAIRRRNRRRRAKKDLH